MWRYVGGRNMCVYVCLTWLGYIINWIILFDSTTPTLIHLTRMGNTNVVRHLIYMFVVCMSYEDGRQQSMVGCMFVWLAPCFSIWLGYTNSSLFVSLLIVCCMKTDDSSRWLEYRAGLKQWQAKATSEKGTDHCTAYCTSNTNACHR